MPSGFGYIIHQKFPYFPAQLFSSLFIQDSQITMSVDIL